MLEQQNIPVLPRISQSPDQNPIENFWREWKRIIQTKFKPPRNIREPEGWIQLAWKLLASVSRSPSLCSVYVYLKKFKENYFHLEELKEVEDDMTDHWFILVN